MIDVCDQELSDERSVWTAEGVAVCAVLIVLLVAFGGYVVLMAVLPDGADWLVRAASAVAGLWLASRAYRRALRMRGFEPSGLGVPLREDRGTTGP